MDIQQIRKDTIHCANKLFFNSAGASLVPNVVTKKIHEYLLAEEKVGGYKLAEKNSEEINEFYQQTAQLLNCHPRNIAFSHDATDAYTKALSCIDFREGDVIITTNDDYSSNQINFISLQKRYGVKIIRIKNLDNGDLDLIDFEKLINQYQPKLVAVTLIPTNSGLIQDVEAIGEICSKENILYLLDACQSVGQIVVDVKKIKCDFLTATGRKFLRGPRGTGFLFVSDKVLNQGYSPLFIDGHGATWTGKNSYEILNDAKRFELWERSYALIIGFKEAIKYANDIGIENIQIYNEKIIAQLRKRLSVIPNVTLFDKGSKTSNILTFRKKGATLEQIKKTFDDHQVYYSISTKEWGLIDFSKKDVEWVVRLSPHYFNTSEEIDRLSKIIEGIST